MKGVPHFKKDGTVTAGNSSGINDGAAALLLANQEAALNHGYKPKLKWLGSASAGTAPSTTIRVDIQNMIYHASS